MHNLPCWADRRDRCYLVLFRTSLAQGLLEQS